MGRGKREGITGRGKRERASWGGARERGHHGEGQEREGIRSSCNAEVVRCTLAIRIPVTQRFMEEASSQQRYLMY